MFFYLEACIWLAIRDKILLAEKSIPSIASSSHSKRLSEMAIMFTRGEHILHNEGSTMTNSQYKEHKPLHNKPHVVDHCCALAILHLVCKNKDTFYIYMLECMISMQCCLTIIRTVLAN